MLAMILGQKPLAYQNGVTMPQTALPHEDVAHAVATLRAASLENLRDPGWLEYELLPHLGLNDEMQHEFPTTLYPWCGHGLKSWQYPNQFSRYLRHLGDLGIRSYVEIGCRHGGTFIITVEYLRRFGDLSQVAAIDIMRSPIVEAYAEFQAFDYLVASSRSPEALQFLAQVPWDLALIDGDHSMEGCWHDYCAVRNTTRRIALHDIASDVCGGVVQVWKLIEAVVPGHRLLTQQQQYDEVRARTGRSYLGIGVVDSS